MEVGAAGDALVGAVNAAITLFVINHKGREANALRANVLVVGSVGRTDYGRSEEHTSELQSRI